MFTTGYHFVPYGLAVGELLWEILSINFILTENTEVFKESLFSTLRDLFLGHTLRLVSVTRSSFIQSGLITVIISNSTVGKSYNKQKSSYII